VSRGRGAVVAAALLALAPPAPAQDKLLDVDTLYDPVKKVDFGATPPTLTWIDDAHYHWPKTDPKTHRTRHLRVVADTGQAAPLFDASAMKAALSRIDGVGADEAERLSQLPTYTMDDRRTAVLLSIRDDLYHYPFGRAEAVRLTSGPEAEEEPTYSPDGRRVAFVRGNDLYTVDLRSRREQRLTEGGGSDLLNGKLDWVYQEEVYGRNRFRAYWWSPDSARLAFLQLDEKEVRRYPIVDDVADHPVVEQQLYPRPGLANPRVRLGVAAADGGPLVWVDLARPGDAEILIVDVGWTPDGRVAFQVQDREQTWLELCLADPRSGASQLLLREAGPPWVENPGAPLWLKDGTFLFSSERSGFKHVYRYGRDGKLLEQLTSGRWEARTLHGVDEARGWVYFSGTERSAIDGDVYRVRTDGTGLARLSAVPGTHAASFSPAFTRYLDTWSDVRTPPQVRLHRADGREARVVDDGAVPALADYKLSQPERVQVTTRDGFVMEGLMIKPPEFDPRRKYPVYQHAYGGPHAQTVRNAWGGTTYLFHQMLAQRGIVVWMLDNRTASGKGAESVWPGYKRMAVLELQDIEDGVAWLKRQPWVDPARIGINGWSYGGLVVSYALTHGTSFAMGIAGAPVTDWRDYDSIYTERYMALPANNAEGYDLTSPRLAARDLHGRLLLIHGGIDDNVHAQNTMRFAHELQQAGKPFEMMIYPRSRHSVSDPALVKHLRLTMLRFIEDTLLR
jgi:dipeptidyl-peptidase-4